MHAPPSVLRRSRCACHFYVRIAARIPPLTDGYLDLASRNYVFRNTYGDATPNAMGFVYAAVAADLPVAPWNEFSIGDTLEQFGCATFGDYNNGARPRAARANSATRVRRRLCQDALR